MKGITYSKDSIKTLRRLRRNISALIISKIELFASNPSALGNNLEPLRGRPNEFRLRVGDWRVIMTETREVIAVVKIGPRDSVYED